MRRIARSRKPFQVVHVQKGKSPPELEDQEFDMVVSEILGTLTTSESMCKFLAIYRPFLRTFGEVDASTGHAPVFMVPRVTRQFVSVRFRGACFAARPSRAHGVCVSPRAHACCGVRLHDCGMTVA